VNSNISNSEESCAEALKHAPNLDIIENALPNTFNGRVRDMLDEMAA